MRQPILLALLLAASAHAATVYVTTTCTSTSTTTVTHISASSTQIFTSAFPVVETPSAVPIVEPSAAPSPSSILVPLSSSAPSVGSSIVYTSAQVAPFPTVAGTGAAPAPTGTGAHSASGTGAPISPAIPYKGAAAARNPGGLLGGLVAIGAVAWTLCS